MDFSASTLAVTQASMFLSEAEPFLRNFIWGSISSILIIRNVPGAAGGLNDGVISRHPLKNTITSSVILMISNDYTMSLPSETYLKSNPFSWGIMTDYHLMPTLPLEEEASGSSVWQAGFVIPHQITTKKVTVNARVQSSIQQKRVVFRPVAVIQEKQCTVSKIPFMLSEWIIVGFILSDEEKGSDWVHVVLTHLTETVTKQWGLLDSMITEQNLEGLHKDQDFECSI